MTEVSTTQSTQPPNRPPEWLFKNIINPTIKLVLKSPLHRLLSNGLALITFTGRKTGKQFSTPAAYHWLDDNTIMFMTRSPWWKNFQNGETIQLRVKGKTYSATPELIHDHDTVWDYISQFLQRYDGNTRRVGIMLGAEATEAEIRAQADEMIAIKAYLKK